MNTRCLNQSIKQKWNSYESPEKNSFYDPKATLYVIQGNAGNYKGDDDDPSTMT
jgi:hypothetical protein